MQLQSQNKPIDMQIAISSGTSPEEIKSTYYGMIDWCREYYTNNRTDDINGFGWVVTIAHAESAADAWSGETMQIPRHYMLKFFDNKMAIAFKLVHS